MRLSYKVWLAAAAVLALPVFALAEQVSSPDPGFVPNTGQINLGYDAKNRGSTEPYKLPTPAQALAAFMTPVSTQPALGSGTSTAAASTTGSVSPAVPSGPIGAIGVTMPAKFSARNDTLDHVPIMALPLPLSDQQRHNIYRAVMADQTPVATDAGKLAPASVLSAGQYFDDLHPLPPSVQNIAAVKSLAYVKSGNKVLLVEPSTRIVFDEINS